MVEREAFMIGIAATNVGKEVLDPELHRVQLFINGRESMIWNDTIGNGRREARWFALPPGERVSLTWSTLGKLLFLAPGEYTLALHSADEKWKPVQVHVLAG
jgi:hypothetical protein